MKSRGVNNFLLALTAFIWGGAFVAQSVGMDYLGPFTFNSIRSLMGGIVLIPVIFAMRHIRRKRTGQEQTGHTGSGTDGTAAENRTLLIGGICCGIALAVGGLLFVSTVAAIATSSLRIYENALYVGSFARRVILFPEEVMYIRYGEVDAVGRQFATVDRGYVYIKPEQGKEIKLSEYSYGGMTEYIRGWQTGHEISEPRD